MTDIPLLTLHPKSPSSPAAETDLRAVDFFCGAGGMTHGLLSAGIDVLAGIDNHGPCQATFENSRNNLRPDGSSPTFVEADVAELSSSDLADQLGLQKDDDALVFVGCSPCQYWSKVNTNREKSQKSKSLLEHFRRLVDDFRPGYIVVENVPGLQRGAKKSGLADFLEFLEEAGYAFDQGSTPLCFYGVPQKRSRYLLLGTRISRNEEPPGISLPPRDKADGRFPEAMKLKHHIGVANGFPSLKAGERSDSPSLHWAANLAAQNLARLRITPPDGGSRDAWKDDPDLQIEAYKGKDHIFRDVYGRMSWDAPAPTITTRFNSLSNGRFGHPEEDRAISLREGATLQTFPLNFVFPKSCPEAARQIGNAVPPELARRIGKHLIEHRRSAKSKQLDD